MPAAPAPSILPPPAPDSRSASEPRHAVDALLKNPARLANAVANREALGTAASQLLAAGLVGHAVFGLAFGLFAGWPVAVMDALKVPLVALASLLLCFPSLYVFACVAGIPLSLSQAVVLGSACFAMIGLLLVALAPVAWLFAVSTASAAFVVLLVFLLWLIAIGFAARFVDKLKVVPLFQRQAGIKLWFLIFMLVTLQMTTCLRPMLAQPTEGWRTPPKQFFLSHFADALGD
ncbi:MAG: hypothetical protein GX548_00535 [Lentisphaerae bacterium]|nr:hypothetical protein [Lentisphaerota bacterium]